MYDKEELISLDELTERVKDKDALLLTFYKGDKRSD